MSRLDVAYLLASDPVLWWHWERLEDDVDADADAGDDR